MDQASNKSNNMDAECEDSTEGQGRAGLAFQGKIVQGRVRIASARKDLHSSFAEEVDSLKY